MPGPRSATSPSAAAPLPPHPAIEPLRQAVQTAQARPHNHPRLRDAPHRRVELVILEGARWPTLPRRRLEHHSVWSRLRARCGRTHPPRRVFVTVCPMCQARANRDGTEPLIAVWSVSTGRSSTIQRPQAPVAAVPQEHHRGSSAAGRPGRHGRPHRAELVLSGTAGERRHQHLTKEIAARVRVLAPSLLACREWRN